MHTDDMLEVIEGVSRRLGNQLHIFVNATCPVFSTQELLCEVESCRRHQAWEGECDQNHTCRMLTTVAGGHCPMVMNLSTYKLHALGDYPTQIQMYGTTDSYLTQSVMVFY